MAKIADTSPVGDTTSTFTTIRKPGKKVPRQSLHRLTDFVHHMYTQVGLAVCLILSLYLPDIYVIVNADESTDDIFDVLLIIIFVAFVGECILLSLTTKKYLLGFFFWMDVAGTLSILIDIRMISKGLGLNGSSDASLLKAARIAKIGAKSGRLMKLTKLFKIFEMFFIYKGDITKDKKLPHAKEISKELSGLLSRRVASLVMIIILLTPLLTYMPIDDSNTAHIESFDQMYDREGGGTIDRAWWGEVFIDFKKFYVNKDMYPIEVMVGVTSGPEILEKFDLGNDGEYIREDSKLVVQRNNIAGTFSMKYQLQLESMYNLFIISLTIVLLIGFSMSFQNSVDELVVLPLERMMKTLKTSASSILKSVQQIHNSQEDVDEEDAENSDLLGEDASISRRRKSIVLNSLENEFDNMLETEVLETIVSKLAKITSLVLPGSEQRYVSDNMDQSTKDWINQEYLDAGRDTERSEKVNMAALSGSSKKRKTKITAAKNMEGKVNGEPKLRSTLVNSTAKLKEKMSPKISAKRRWSIRDTKEEALSTSQHQVQPSPDEGQEQQVVDIETGCSLSANNEVDAMDSDERKQKASIEDTDWEEMESELSTWTFDITLYKDAEAFACLHLIFETFDIPDELSVSNHTMIRFYNALSQRYIAKNTYHNFFHAVDVTQTVYRFVKETQANVFLMPLETASLTIASLAHDVGHPGLSNQFLIKTKHETAILYNDQSPLENMHCATLYEIVRDSKVDVFKGLDGHQWRAVRKVIISSILGTDMVHHFSTISKLQVFYEMNGKKLQQEIISGQCNAETASGLMEASNRSFIIEVFLHAADISNPVKTFDICKKWADRVCEEFFLQGDKEKSLQMSISTMTDRATVNKNSMQIGFIEYVVCPLYESFVKLFPTLSPLLDNLVVNCREWTNRLVQETRNKRKPGFSDEILKLEKRYSALSSKLGEVVKSVEKVADDLNAAKAKTEDIDKLVNMVSMRMDSERISVGGSRGRDRSARTALTDVFEETDN